MKKVLMEGPISPDKIAGSIASHSSKKNIGAHSIFLGQVRADQVDGRIVSSIDYSCYPEMAEEEFHRIREETFEKFPLTCMHLYHSTGVVKAGEICLFIFVSSQRRKAAMEACNYLVEAIKARVPVWGKEVFEDESYKWKENTV
jgi:molybdopterin synthase catalytic subunit